jgi:hypothetical protein
LFRLHRGWRKVRKRERINEKNDKERTQERNKEE